MAKEWFFYQAWAGLADSVRDGHARIPPWRQRQAADPGGSLDFLRALDDLAARFGVSCLPWPAWTGPAGCSRWAAGPAPMPPPWPGPCPAWRRPSWTCRRSSRSWPSATPSSASSPATSTGPASAARPPSAGTPSCWPTSSTTTRPAAVALFDLMMLVENEGGAAWPAATLTGWLRAAGLTGIKLRRGAGPIAVLRGTAPGPPDPPGPRLEAPGPPDPPGPRLEAPAP